MEGDIGPAFTVDSVVMFLGSLGGGFFLSRVWGAKLYVADAEKLVDAFISNLS
jgi:hypothetical protein